MATFESAATQGQGRSLNGTRVVAILDTWIVSGPGRQLAALAVGLQPHGVALSVIMFQRRGRSPSPFSPYLAQLGVPFVVLEDRGPLDLGALRRLKKALDEYHPHIV